MFDGEEIDLVLQNRTKEVLQSVPKSLDEGQGRRATMFLYAVRCGGNMNDHPCHQTSAFWDATWCIFFQKRDSVLELSEVSGASPKQSPGSRGRQETYILVEQLLIVLLVRPDYSIDRIHDGRRCNPFTSGRVAPVIEIRITFGSWCCW